MELFNAKPFLFDPSLKQGALDEEWYANKLVVIYDMYNGLNRFRHKYFCRIPTAPRSLRNVMASPLLF